MRSRMTQRARIERDVLTGTKSSRGTPDRSTIFVGHQIPCYFWTLDSRTTPEGVVATITDARIAVPISVDVREHDRVVRVVSKSGDVIVDKPMRVVAVIQHRAGGQRFTECEVTAVR